MAVCGVLQGQCLVVVDPLENAATAFDPYAQVAMEDSLNSSLVEDLHLDVPPKALPGAVTVPSQASGKKLINHFKLIDSFVA
ncbi:hypothetical protein SUGI_0897010 [Cryptomeria japonica]|nr:hypothetical protein SUGI_0897010 [Cryptomeria japonica]